MRGWGQQTSHQLWARTRIRLHRARRRAATLAQFLHLWLSRACVARYKCHLARRCSLWRLRGVVRAWEERAAEARRVARGVTRCRLRCGGRVLEAWGAHVGQRHEQRRRLDQVQSARNRRLLEAWAEWAAQQVRAHSGKTARGLSCIQEQDRPGVCHPVNVIVA